jgi:hypothetical protein
MGTPTRLGAHFLWDAKGNAITVGAGKYPALRKCDLAVIMLEM